MARRVVPAEGEWECMNCGYIKAGLADQVPRRCPQCGAGADMFAPECGAPANMFVFYPYEYTDEDWEWEEEWEAEEEV